jgi:hypothetical protein
MNVTGLEELHQGKSHDETDGRPFETSQSGIQHPARILAQPKAMLKRTRSKGILGPQRRAVQHHISALLHTLSHSSELD